jgi:hypothetical protein
MSPVATFTPPRNESSNAKTDFITFVLTGSITMTCGDPPTPAPATIITFPVPNTSSAATFTPPRNDSLKA